MTGTIVGTIIQICLSLGLYTMGRTIEKLINTSLHNMAIIGYVVRATVVRATVALHSKDKYRNKNTSVNSIATVKTITLLQRMCLHS